MESFNQLVNHNLHLAVESLRPVKFDVHGQTITASIVGCHLAKPTYRTRGDVAARPITPAECRQLRVSYKGDVTFDVRIKVGAQTFEIKRYAGQVPVMVLSDKCHLVNASRKELINSFEDEDEFGGYFIVNGNEKVVRMLLMARRNHPMCLNRPTFTNRGSRYSNCGVQIRCVRPDETSQRLVLHLIEGGRCTLGFSIRKRQYLVPAILLLRAFKEVTERDIFDAIVRDSNDSTLIEHTRAMLDAAPANTNSQGASLDFIGAMFRVELGVHDSMRNTEVAHLLFKEYIFIHIDPQDYTVCCARVGVWGGCGCVSVWV